MPDVELTTSEVPLGTVVPFFLAPTNVPDGWLLCDGQLIPPEFEDLIRLLGSGNTPSLAGLTLIGAGRDQNGRNWRQGDSGGEVQHTLLDQEMPAHRHTINNGDFGTHWRSFMGDFDDDRPYETNPDGDDLKATDISGGGLPHNNMQPYFVVNYIIFAGKPLPGKED